MESKCESVNAYTRKLTVNASVEEVDAAYAKALRKVAKTATVRGYRPGKVPATLLERAYGPAIQDEAQTSLIDSTLQAAMAQHSLSPIARPNVQIGQVAAKQPLEYTTFVEVRPKIEIGKVDGLAVEVPPAADIDALVDERLEALREENAQVEPITDRDTVGGKDVVVINYAGKIDGKSFAGSADAEVQFDVENSGFIPGFAEGLLGAKVPGQRTLQITFPEDYGSKKLAGKPAEFEVELIELKSRRLPALDDEFAKDLGHDDLAALRADVRTKVQESEDKTARKGREDAILRALAEANPIEVPPSMVESQLDRMMRQRLEQFERVTRQKIKLTEAQLDSLRREILPEAEFAVRCGLLLLETSRQLKLEVSEAEVAEEIERRILQWPDQIDEARASLSSPEFKEDLRYSLLEDKTLKHLLEHAKLTEAAAAPAKA